MPASHRTISSSTTLLSHSYGGVFEFEFGGVKKKKVQYLLYAAYRTGLHTAKSCQGCITHTYMTYKQRYRRTISYVLSEISVLGGREKGTRGWKGNMGGFGVRRMG